MHVCTNVRVCARVHACVQERRRCAHARERERERKGERGKDRPKERHEPRLLEGAGIGSFPCHHKLTIPKDSHRFAYRRATSHPPAPLLDQLCSAITLSHTYMRISKSTTFMNKTTQDVAFSEIRTHRARAHTRAHANVHTHPYTRIRTDAKVHKHTYTRTRTRTRAHVHVHTYKYLCRHRDYTQNEILLTFVYHLRCVWQRDRTKETQREGEKLSSQNNNVWVCVDVCVLTFMCERVWIKTCMSVCVSRE